MKETKAFLNEIVKAIGSLAFVGKSLFQLVCYLAYFSQPILIQAILAADATGEALLALSALAISLLMPAVIDLTNNGTMQDFRRYSKGLVFGRLLQRGYGYYQDRPSSEIQSYLNEVSFACRNLEDRWVHTVLRMTAMGLLYICSLSMQSIALGLAYAAFFTAYLVVSAWLSSRGRGGVGDFLASTAQANVDIADVLGNVSTIYTLRTQNDEERRIWDSLDDEAARYRALQRKSNVSALFQIVMVVCFAAVLLMVSLEQRTSIAATLLTLLYSILNLTGFGSQYLLMCEMLDRLSAALCALELDSVKAEPANVSYDSKATSLVLRDVCYSYPHTKRNLLRNLSVAFEKGSVIAIVGPNGSGKSTLLKVIAGLLKPNSGRLLVPYDRDCKTMLIGQGTTLFNRTIAENLFYPSPAGDVDLAMRLVREIGLDSVVAAKELLFTLKPGDLAGKVSGGELQKVQILRAIICKPDILLCDEITSGLDVESVERFYAMLRRYLPGTTVICVVHRQNELKYFDEIAEM